MCKTFSISAWVSPPAPAAVMVSAIAAPAGEHTKLSLPARTWRYRSNPKALLALTAPSTVEALNEEAQPTCARAVTTQARPMLARMGSRYVLLRKTQSPPEDCGVMAC